MRAAAGLLAGAATFVAVNTLLDSRVADASADQREKVEQAARGVGFALLAAVTLDVSPRTWRSACRWWTAGA